MRDLLRSKMSLILVSATVCMRLHLLEHIFEEFKVPSCSEVRNLCNVHLVPCARARARAHGCVRASYTCTQLIVIR